MAKILKIRKVTALPGTLEASTLYLVSTADPSILDLYVSSSDGSSARHIVTKSEIQTMINTAVAALDSALVVADINARNALSPTKNVSVIVLNATGDPTVASGAATYVYDNATSTWYKISESESMDVILTWASLQGKPTSTPAAIDDAVTKAHTHANKTTLDLLTDPAGELLYNAAPIRAYLDEEAW
jgi:hypothetical protein